VIFTPTPLAGAFVLEPEPVPDSRGLFARTWCERELTTRGLETRIAQCSTSFNKRKGTLRGLHYQVPPLAETKLVRCTRGSIHDVIVDLRRESSTFARSFAAVLSADNRKAMYVPVGFAHGFQTLEDDTEVFYQISQFYSPEHSRGVRWDDPVVAIAWPPESDRTISDRDRGYPDLRRETFELR
jgi:dTDP-4-dehydrorhamnose 3,5-epimerase